MHVTSYKIEVDISFSHNFIQTGTPEISHEHFIHI